MKERRGVRERKGRIRKGRKASGGARKIAANQGRAKGRKSGGGGKERKIEERNSGRMKGGRRERDRERE